jgi:SAM-dependent methyltransferase
MSSMTAPSVVWHDLECGAYVEDQPLWRSLASDSGDPVLEIGAGTGRIALDLARRGHDVTALDNDASLLAALGARAAVLKIETVLADARSFEIDRRFGLCMVPMQTIQLLDGIEGRSSFLACARRHVVAGGLLALALAQELDTYDVTAGSPAPAPDLRELDGVVYASLPVAVREQPDAFVLERRREVVAARGEYSVDLVQVRLDRLDAAQLEHEAEALGFGAEARAHIPANDEYAGSVVVMLRG